MNRIVDLILIMVFFCPSLFVFAEDTGISRIQNDIDHHDTVDIDLNPLMEFNDKSKEEILNMRRDNIQKVPGLAPKDYGPNMAIFGQIQDNKPWWGLLGIDFYGNGEKSILGNSKESRFLLNPYLLVGVEEIGGHIVHDQSLVPDEFYHQPTQLTWEKTGAWGSVTYNVTNFYKEALLFHFADAQQLYLSDYNARDFGYNFFVIDSTQSENINGAQDKIIPITQFIHVGGSCGYPGGCNNKSPHQDDLIITWTRLPARIFLKLWKNSPSDMAQKEDMDFLIDLN